MTSPAVTRRTPLLAGALLSAALSAHTAFAACPKINLGCSQSIPPVVVGSPSGQVGSYDVALYTGTGAGCSGRHLLTSADIGFAVEIWLAIDGDFCAPDNLRLYTNDPGGNSLHCGNGECVDWHYLEEVGNPVTFHPRFGGFGQLNLQLELPCSSFPNICPGYIGIACVQARSTDFDVDGDTDQSEKLTLGQELLLPQASRNIQYDFNVDGVVDAADYRLVANEMLTEIAQGHPQIYTCPPNNCPLVPCAPIALTGTFVNDTNAPGAVALASSGSGSNVVLSWTSPGDDTSNGVAIGVAQSFELRGSMTPITPGNFASATLVGNLPVPGLPGTSHQVTLNSCSPSLKYFAIRTRDWAGNVSPISNVITVSMTSVTDLASLSHCTSLDLSWTAPCLPGAPVSYDLRKSRSTITLANWSQATPVTTNPPSAPGAAELLNLPLGACSGRWYFALRASDAFGNTTALSNVTSGSTPCVRNCIDDFASRPADADETVSFGLSVPRPNPSASRATIRFRIPADRLGDALDLGVFDAAGRRIRSLSAPALRPGESVVEWNLDADDGHAVSSGVYFIRLRLGTDTRMQSIMVLR